MSGPEPTASVMLDPSASRVAEVRALVIRAVATVADVDADAVVPETTLESLGIDSFALTEVLLELEDLLQMQLPADVLASLRGWTPTTVSDLLGAIHVD